MNAKVGKMETVMSECSEALQCYSTGGLTRFVAQPEDSQLGIARAKSVMESSSIVEEQPSSQEKPMSSTSSCVKGRRER